MITRDKSMDTDTNYEFNAPQYIDFLNDAEMENLDDWFGKYKTSLLL